MIKPMVGTSGALTYLNQACDLYYLSVVGPHVVHRGTGKPPLIIPVANAIHRPLYNYPQAACIPECILLT